MARWISSGPAGHVIDLADLVDQRLVDAAGLHDVRLLPEVLGEQLAGPVQCERRGPRPASRRPAGAGRCPRTAAPARAAPACQRVQRLPVVGRPDHVVEDHAVADLPGQLHHLHARRPDVDRGPASGTGRRARCPARCRPRRRTLRGTSPAPSPAAAATVSTSRAWPAAAWVRLMPTFDASGSHHAPMPRITRPGARSSSVENVAASRPTFRVQLLTTPEPTLIRSVTAAKAAIGHGRLPDQPALRLPHGLEPVLLRVLHVLHALPDGVLVLQVHRDAALARHAHRLSLALLASPGGVERDAALDAVASVASHHPRHGPASRRLGGVAPWSTRVRPTATDHRFAAPPARRGPAGPPSAEHPVPGRGSRR